MSARSAAGGSWRLPSSGPTSLVGGDQSDPAGGADGLASAGVLVVWSDKADRLVETNGVICQAHPFELGGEDGGVGEGEQVGVLGLDVAPQRLDPGLVGRGVGPPEVLADGEQRHE